MRNMLQITKEEVENGKIIFSSIYIILWLYLTLQYYHLTPHKIIFRENGTEMKYVLWKFSKKMYYVEKIIKIIPYIKGKIVTKLSKIESKIRLI